MATKKTQEYGFDFINHVNIRGIVKNVLVSTDKVAVYNVEIPSKTTKGNVAKCWAKVVDFNNEVEYEEGDALQIIGSLSTNSYESKGKTIFELRIVADTIGVIGEDIEDAIPFN